MLYSVSNTSNQYFLGRRYYLDDCKLDQWCQAACAKASKEYLHFPLSTLDSRDHCLDTGSFAKTVEKLREGPEKGASAQFQISVLSSFWRNREENACDAIKKVVLEAGGRQLGKRACPIHRTWTECSTSKHVIRNNYDIKRKLQGKQLNSGTGGPCIKDREGCFPSTCQAQEGCLSQATPNCEAAGG